MYKSLLLYNVDFLTGKTHKTYYYDGDFGEVDGVTHRTSKNNLIRLHMELDLYTINGQSNFCDDNIEEQKSYLDFFIEPKNAEQLYTLLVNDGRVYLTMYNPITDKITTNTIAKQRYNLTRDRMNSSEEWREYTNTVSETIEEYYEEHLELANARIRSVLYGLCLFSVFVKEYCSPITVEEIILSYLDSGVITNVDGLFTKKEIEQVI